MDMESVPGVGRWQPAQRRKASIVSIVAAGVLILFALLAIVSFPASGQSDSFLLAVLVILIALLVFQALVVVTGLKQRAAPDLPGSAAWQEAYAPVPPRAVPASQELTLKCSSCGTVFDVRDTGERPLRHTCPGCGVQGELTEADLGPAPGAAITLKCGSCGTVFDVPDTGQRPLQHVCPGCGSEGVLREEDLPPTPLPQAAPLPPPRPPAPRPGAAARTPAAVRVKTLKLRCKNCSTVFTLRDAGERPLYHECPGCKATGVLR